MAQIRGPERGKSVSRDTLDPISGPQIRKNRAGSNTNTEMPSPSTTKLHHRSRRPEARDQSSRPPDSSYPEASDPQHDHYTSDENQKKETKHSSSQR